MAKAGFKIENVLEKAGIAVAIISQPELGAGAFLEFVNEPFATLLRRPLSEEARTGVSRLRELVSDGTDWSALCKALQAGVAASFEVRPRAGHPNEYVSLRLTFAAMDMVTVAVLVAHDLQAPHPLSAKADDTQRLLAEIFARIATPVVIVTATGTIMLANPAMHQMHGYSGQSMHGLRVADLAAPPYKEATRAAHEKQFRDGQVYEMRIETLAKGNVPIPVRLFSAQLRDGDQRLRVVTLIREQPLPGEARKIGELRAVSLSAFRSLYGPRWEEVASRAMMKAEHIIRDRLGPGDVVSRTDDHNFVIWFESTDESQNSQSLAAIVRMIRLRFMTEFGRDVASHVSAAIVPSTGTAGAGAAAAAAQAPKPAKAVEQMKWARR